MELRQLEHRIEEERRRDELRGRLERQQREAERQQREAERDADREARLAQLKDAAELAAKEAELRKAAENDLEWDRRHDFDGESVQAIGASPAKQLNEAHEEAHPLVTDTPAPADISEKQAGHRPAPESKRSQSATAWISNAGE